MTDGGGFGVAAGALAQIGAAGRPDNADDGRDPRQKLFERLHQIPIGPVQIPISAGAGVYQMNDLLMPKAGYMWSIRNLTAAGYSAGSIVAYKGGAIVGGAFVGLGLAQPFGFSAAGVATIGRGEFLFDQGDALILVATGVTLVSGYAGVQIVGAADCFERWYLPEYLG